MVAERIEARSEKLSGWQIRTLDRVTTQSDDKVTDVATLTRTRAALLKVILLPVGYSVAIHGNSILKVVDSSSKVVFTA